MQQSKTKIPENVVIAINAILSPYNATFESLLTQSSPQADRVRYLSIRAAETYCGGTSRYTISRAVKNGKLTQIKLSQTQQGKVLFDRVDLDKWLKNLKSKGIGK